MRRTSQKTQQFWSFFHFSMANCGIFSIMDPGAPQWEVSWKTGTVYDRI
jgi:hypothetical protein